MCRYNVGGLTLIINVVMHILHLKPSLSLAAFFAASALL